MVAELKAGRYYVNVHSPTNAGGEIRGQLLRMGEQLFRTTLSGANEVPAVTTTATGGVQVIVSADMTKVNCLGTFTGVTATAAHIHRAAAGMNGPVVIPFVLGTGTLSCTDSAITATNLADLTGGTINVSADNHGIIAGTGITGAIDYETGVVRARFGSWVIAAGNEDEIWFDPDGVVVLDGVPKVFKPAPVFADTVKYNAVAYSYLPLDADLIGLDPVRLPQDGRVPIFRMGDFAVIGHTETVGPFTASAGQVVGIRPPGSTAPERTSASAAPMSWRRRSENR